MEVSLSISNAVKPAPTRTAPVVSPQVVHAPSVLLPMQFIMAGLLALLAGVGWLVATPGLLATYHYNQSVIAVTHLFVLGWICSVIMGAMYQLVPVALETKLYSERLARWQFAFHLIGFVGMVWAFNVWDLKQVGHFGSVLAVGVVLFVYNIARTLWRVPKWNATAAAIAASLVWLSLAILAGLFVAAAKCTYETVAVSAPATLVNALLLGLRSVAGLVAQFDAISTMHAHAHLGSVGFFIMLIIGVSYKLVPMFTLSEVQSPRRAAWSIALLNFGLVGSFVTILLRSPWKLIFAMVMIAALAVYAWELAAILRVRNRRKLDWSIKYFLTAIILLLPVVFLAIALSWPGLPVTVVTGQLENVYGFLGFFGVVTFAIIGMLYKIIPFLVWFKSYSQKIGHIKIPALADLYSTRLQAVGYWTFLAGITITCVAALFSNEIAVRLGCSLLMASVLVLVLNVGVILSHLVRPKIKSLAPQSVPIKADHE